MGIYFENVTFYYDSNKKYVFENVNLKINAQNEFIALIGKIGSGKSTLTQLMNSLLLPSIGKIKIFDYTIDSKTRPESLTPIRRKVGLVFQFPEYQLFETTVLKDVMFSPKNFGKNNFEAKQIAKEVLNKVGIHEDLFNVSPFKLSVGQQRKVAIAGVLAMRPSILILDEPTRGLDVKGQLDIMNILQKQNQKDKKTIIFITHDIDLVAHYANKVILLDNKKVVFFDSKEFFFMNRNFANLGFQQPQTFEILKLLENKFGFPFKPKYSFLELSKYLRKFYQKENN